MSAAIDNDATSTMALALVTGGRPAEFRSATDIVSPLNVICNATLNKQTPPAPLYFDSWLFETLFVINSYRNVLDGWDGYAAPAPTKAALDAAEMLAAFFALSAPDRRPSLCIDVLGRPAFATNIPGFYIHLTIDNAGFLTWYAVSGEAEHFMDDVAFDGRRLPEALGSLFLLSDV